MGMLLVIIAWIILAPISIALYVVMALGIQTLARNKGLGNDWLAWVPILQLYLIGMIIEEFKIFDFVVPTAQYVLPGAYLAIAIFGYIPILGTLLSIAILVFNYFWALKLFNMYRPQSATTYALLSVFLFPIMLFIIRNDTPIAHHQ